MADPHAYTNELVRETSPYLLQHAHNPVNWYPWGEKAFAEARRTGKPIFLSIGYSTCYWCHVMERQVFENPQIAAVMNEHCINIKVDREERPDIDDIYMTAVQLMTRSGGWPMSVFLTPPGARGADDPGLKPFWAGTYVPPTPAYGRQGFPQLVEGLSDAWRMRRQEVMEVSQRVAAAVTEQLSERGEAGALNAESVSAAANQLLRGYDEVHGGFGGAPKFPSPTNLLFLLRVHQSNSDADLWKALSHTLERMARGGMNDQVGGGVHRYSTDEKWLVPHFEKMLYDNALLVEAYLVAHAIKPHEGDPTLYTRTVRQTLDYVLRDMTDSTGAFWSAQDAEVDAREGDNYLWNEQQVRDAIGDKKLADIAVKLYGLDRGTNFQDPHDHSAPPANVLFVPEPYPQMARAMGMSPDDLLKAEVPIDAKLLAVRNQRKQPGTDDKVLTAWNGLMIAAMAHAGRDLNEPLYTKAAAAAADYILGHMRAADGSLLRTMRRGKVRDIPGFLEDYAYFVHGLIELHCSTQDRRWLDSARELARIADHNFADPRGGYFDTLADRSDLFVRVRSTYDGATPSGNSQMAHDLIDLYEITTDRAWLDQSARLLRAFASELEAKGAGMAHMQHALLRALTHDPKKLAGARHDDLVAVTASASDVFVNDGQSAEFDVMLTIREGYHINASEVDEGLIPTQLKLDGGRGISLDVKYPKPKTAQFPFADKPLKVYEGKLSLHATVKLTSDNYRLGDARLVITYQACSETECLPSREVEVPVSISLAK